MADDSFATPRLDPSIFRSESWDESNLSATSLPASSNNGPDTLPKTSTSSKSTKADELVGQLDSFHLDRHSEPFGDSHNLPLAHNASIDAKVPMVAKAVEVGKNKGAWMRESYICANAKQNTPQATESPGTDISSLSESDLFGDESVYQPSAGPVHSRYEDVEVKSDSLNLGNEDTHHRDRGYCTDRNVGGSVSDDSVDVIIGPEAQECSLSFTSDASKKTDRDRPVVDDSAISVVLCYLSPNSKAKDGATSKTQHDSLVEREHPAPYNDFGLADSIKLSKAPKIESPSFLEVPERLRDEPHTDESPNWAAAPEDTNPPIDTRRRRARRAPKVNATSEANVGDSLNLCIHPGRKRDERRRADAAPAARIRTPEPGKRVSTLPRPSHELTTVTMDSQGWGPGVSDVTDWGGASSTHDHSGKGSGRDGDARAAISNDEDWGPVASNEQDWGIAASPQAPSDRDAESSGQRVPRTVSSGSYEPRTVARERPPAPRVAHNSSSGNWGHGESNYGMNQGFGRFGGGSPATNSNAVPIDPSRNRWNRARNKPPSAPAPHPAPQQMNDLYPPVYDQQQSVHGRLPHLDRSQSVSPRSDRGRGRGRGTSPGGGTPAVSKLAARLERWGAPPAATWENRSSSSSGSQKGSGGRRGPGSEWHAPAQTSWERKQHRGHGFDNHSGRTPVPSVYSSAERYSIVTGASHSSGHEHTEHHYLSSHRPSPQPSSDLYPEPDFDTDTDQGEYWLPIQDAAAWGVANSGGGTHNTGW